MSNPDIVMDTSVVIAALRSSKGASYKLLSLVGTNKFEIHVSVPLVLEYEDVIQRIRTEIGLSQDDISIFIDSICSMARHHKIYFLWRPSLPDASDEFLLELAVSAKCEYIVTHNIRDMSGTEKFGITAITPKDFLQLIGEVKK